MVKKIFFVAIALSFSLKLWAQGTILFADNPSFTVLTNNLNNYGSAVPSTFQVALYWGVLGSTDAQLVQIGPAIHGSGGLGLFNGGVYTTPNGTAPGVNAVFEVKGWTGNFSTFEAAVAAAPSDHTILTDFSGGWVNATGTGPGNAAAFQFGVTGFNCIVLAPIVPEPSTMILGGLGAAAMLLYRRRGK
jgi:hypothetical protein